MSLFNFNEIITASKSNPAEVKIFVSTVRESLALFDASRVVGAGLATIALAGVGVGVGVIFGKLIEGLSINLGAEKELRKTALLGFALTEAVALFALMMAFLMLFGI